MGDKKDLNNNDFWDVFYDYDASDLESVIQKGAQEMIKHGCRCDRKEHTAVSQASLCVVGHQLIAVRRNPDTRVLWCLAHVTFSF